MHLLVAWHPMQVVPIAPQLLVDCMANGTHVVGPEQHPAHEVESQTHCPALLQSNPVWLHLPLLPVQVPPAPSEPPQATPAQLATLQIPWSLTKFWAHVTAMQFPWPSHEALIAFGAVHAVVFDAGVCEEHCPVAEAHVPGTWQTSVALQPTAGPAVHTPPRHVSGVVHALLSALHAMPSVALGYEHVPVVGLHVPAVWHCAGAAHTIAWPGMQTPLWQVSFCVHALPSSHAAPLVGAHVPVLLAHAEQPLHVVVSFCHCPLASHVCGCAAPLHCFEPGVHTPEQAPLAESQTKLHAFPLSCH
jgi:hypothetical protein